MDFTTKAENLFNYKFDKKADKLNKIRKILAPYINYCEYLNYLLFICNPSFNLELPDELNKKLSTFGYVRNRIIHTHITVKRLNSKVFANIEDHFLNDIALFYNDELTIYGLINYIASHLSDDLIKCLANDLGLRYKFEGVENYENIKTLNDIKIVTSFYMELDDMCVQRGNSPKNLDYYKIEDAKSILNVGGTIFKEVKDMRDAFFHGMFTEHKDEDMLSRFIEMIKNIKAKTNSPDIVELCDKIN